LKQSSPSRRHTLHLSLLGFIVAGGLYGQTTATIVGTVVDESGAAVPNVTVQIKNELTGLVRESQAGGEGGYVANLLPPGTYSVSVSADGFKRSPLTEQGRRPFVQKTGMAHSGSFFQRGQLQRGGSGYVV